MRSAAFNIINTVKSKIGQDEIQHLLIQVVARVSPADAMVLPGIEHHF